MIDAAAILIVGVFLFVIIRRSYIRYKADKF